jgi:GTP-binding protein
LFVVSNKDGLSQDDYYISKILKKSKNKNVILVVNKSENIDHQNEKQYFSLGFGKPFYISAEHGIGVGDLLDEIIKNMSPIQNLSNNNTKSLTFCIIGRTNTGKSTLTNTLLNEDRVLVSPMPHTTRDSIDADFTFDGNDYTIIDTAGIRRKGKITSDIEKYAILRTQRAVERSQIIILLINGNESINEQDEIIGGIAYKSNLPTIICVNK